MVGKQEDNKNNKSLIAIFAALTAVIAALVVAIVVIVTTQPEPDIATEPEPELTPEQKEIQELAAKYEEEGYVNAESKAIAEIFWSNYNSAIEEANTIMEQSPPDIDAIKDIFLPQMDKNLSEDQPSYAAMFFKAYYDTLKNNGFKKEAVEAIIDTDLTGFVESKRHEFYQDALTIAEDIGDQDLISQAQAKMATTQEAYDILVESTKRAEENAEPTIIYKENSNETNN